MRITSIIALVQSVQTVVSFDNSLYHHYQNWTEITTRLAELWTNEVFDRSVRKYLSITGSVNLSVNKSADMSSSEYNDKWLADEAVDGDLNQNVSYNSCAITSFESKPQAWWRVDLGAAYAINSVTIYYRRETRCENGKYGVSCQNECDGHCLNDAYCNKAHGGCDSGCDPGYEGFRCEKACSTSFFGMKCSSSCGNCFNSSCNNIDGSCPYGCSAGWKGLYCNETCDLGTYGPNCVNECSQYCSTEAECYSTNGTCYGGCKPGWITHNCNEGCPVGRFGLNCASICSAHCFLNKTCNLQNGFCEGCTEGWMGNFCNQTFGLGHFGRDCLNTCATCKISSCNSLNGLCQNGCIDGYNGTFCNIWIGPERDTLSTDKEANTPVIVLIVTNILTVIALVTAVSLFCRHIRNSQNNPSTQQNRQVTSHPIQLPANPHNGNGSGREASYQPGTRYNENNAYEGLQLNITDTDTYEMLQTDINVTYTNTQLI